MWHSQWYPAPDYLAEVLAGIWSVHAGGENLHARVLPDGTACLVLQRDGSILRSSDQDGTPWAAASVSGPRTGSFDIGLGGNGNILIVQLQPAGATHALGVPMSSLADRFEQLDAVVGSSLSQTVTDAVVEGIDELSCVRAIEQWLLARVRSGRKACDVADAVVREVAREVGSIRVEKLAEHVNLSRRHLGRVMRERVGLTTKMFSRVTRFHHAVQRGRVRPIVPWARVAIDAGYADQAHLAREFAELGGIRPRDLHGVASATLW